MNYLLFALVVSLCIFYFYNQYDGFQTSPVDFNNFNGTLTGIRVSIIDPNGPGGHPEDILRGILGTNLTETESRLLMERPNGDLVIPYGYINPTGDIGSVEFQDNPYNVPIFPEIITAIVTGGENPMEILGKTLFTFNFSRNPKITPTILTNQNIKLMFNNIYANLYKMNLKVVSLILNNTIDFPTLDYSKYSLPVPILTPKVRVNLETRFSSITVKTSLSDILQRFKLFILQLTSQNAPVQITSINPDGTTTPLVITSAATAGTGPAMGGPAPGGGNTPPGGNRPPGGNTPPTFLINNGSIQVTFDIKVYKLNFMDNIFLQIEQNTNTARFKISSGYFGFGQSQNTIRFLFENSPKIPDSTIQMYIGSLFLSFKYSIIDMFKEIDGVDNPYTPEQIVSINLSNPPQEIKVDIGTEINVNNTNPSTILDQLKKLLCV